MRARVRDTELYFDVDGMGLVPDGARMVERPALFLVHGGPGGEHSRFKTNSARCGTWRSCVRGPPRLGTERRGRPRDVHPRQQHRRPRRAARAPRAQRISMLGPLRRDGRPGLRPAVPRAGREPDPRLHGAELPVHRGRARIVKERARPTRSASASGSGTAPSRISTSSASTTTSWGRSTRDRFRLEQFDDGWARGKPSFVALNRGFGDFLRTFDFTDASTRSAARRWSSGARTTGSARPALPAHRRADPAGAAQDLRGQRPRGGERRARRLPGRGPGLPDLRRAVTRGRIDRAEGSHGAGHQHRRGRAPRRVRPRLKT